jgi:hypothetical protein
MPAAADVKSADKKAIAEIARDLFAERSARAFGRNVKSLAIQCYRDAATFHEISQLYELDALETDKPAGPQLSEVSAPNLKKTHPHNLVSRRFGDLKKVREVNAWLKANPTAETYEDLEWDAPTTKLARILFPEFIVDEKPAALAR